VLAAAAFARIGDIAQANRLIRELEKSYTSDRMLTLYWLPCIRAAIDLHNGNAAAALPQVQVPAAYELGWPTNWATTLYPNYLRGESYLLGRDGATAAGEFQKLIDKLYLVLNFVTAALAPLQLACPWAMAGNDARAKVAYHKFFDQVEGRRPRHIDFEASQGGVREPTVMGCAKTAHAFLAGRAKTILTDSG
jgi:hypothetical protein